MDKDIKSPVYEHRVIEFVTVAVEYCTYLEQAEDKQRHEFIDTTLKILPLLYLKGALLPQYEIFSDFSPVDYVTEENYDIIRNNIAFIMGERDDYLDVFVEDMKYSDTPILSTVSENLADIYQDIKNFVCAYKDGNEESMMGALSVCKDNFKNYWGQKLTNVMRALHETCYSVQDDDMTFEE
jgi:hypothetical protein